MVSTYADGNAARLTGIVHDQGGTTLASVAYTLDDVGNRTKRVDQAGTHTYAYDDVYRLTSVTYPGPSTTSYTFDAFGNRTSLTDGSGTTSYAYDDADRITSVTPPSPAPVKSYTWDDNGNLTARGSDSFTWDYEDRMVSATVNSVTTTFAYRGDGLRDSRTTGGNTTYFTWDIAAGLPVVLDDGAQYVYGAGLVSQVSGGDTYYYLADGLGSTMKTVDGSGTVVNAYEYDVYGEVTSTSGSQANEFQFAGQQTDPTGLQYLRARYYDTETGTFLSRDPLAAGRFWISNPNGYAQSNPVNRLDPTGLDGCLYSTCGIDPWQPVLTGGFGFCNGYVCWTLGTVGAGIAGGTVVNAATDDSDAGEVDWGDTDPPFIPSSDDIDRIREHINGLPEGWIDPATEEYLQVLKRLAEQGKPLTREKENFVRHEQREAELMKQGMDYGSAHQQALDESGLTEKDLYPQWLVNKYRGAFNPNVFP